MVNKNSQEFYIERYILKILMDKDKTIDLMNVLALEDFKDGVHREICGIVARYFKKFGEIPTDVIMLDYAEEGLKDAVANRLEKIHKLSIEPAEYGYYLHKFFEMRKQEVFFEEVKDVYVGLTQNTEKPEYYVDSIGKLQEAINYYREKGQRDIHRGDITKESLIYLDEYRKTKYGGEEGLIPSPLGWIDEMSGGARPGRFWVLGGYKGEGKTTVLINFAYTAMKAGKDVLVVSMEMGHMDFMKKIYSRHVVGFDSTITHQGIDKAELSLEQEAALKEALEDLENNPEYGRFIMISAGGMSPDDLRAEIDRYNPDAVYIDYLQLMRPLRRQDTRANTLAELIKDVRAIALEKNVFILTAHQINRNGFNKSRKTGCYTMTDFGETSEIEASATLMMSVYRDRNMIEDNSVRFGIHKNRFGRTDDMGKIVYLDSARNFLGDVQGRVEI